MDFEDNNATIKANLASKKVTNNFNNQGESFINTTKNEDSLKAFRLAQETLHSSSNINFVDKVQEQAVNNEYQVPDKKNKM